HGQYESGETAKRPGRPERRRDEAAKGEGGPDRAGGDAELEERVRAHRTNPDAPRRGGAERQAAKVTGKHARRGRRGLPEGEPGRAHPQHFERERGGTRYDEAEP